MTTEATPREVGSHEGLGLAYPERDYLAYDPFEGDRDLDIRCRTVKLVRARKEHLCPGLERGGSHPIWPGELHRHERAIVDGEWGDCRVCIPCMDKWLTEIGRPKAASPNDMLTAPTEAQRTEP